MTGAAGVTRAFDALVVVHAITAIAAIVVLLVLRAAASAARRGGELSASADRSFTGRPELAGRLVHLVPLTGLAVVAVSRGTYALSTPFVVAGIALWGVAGGFLEAVGFPAQHEVAAARSASEPGRSASSARTMQWAVEVALAALAVAVVVMVASQG